VTTSPRRAPSGARSSTSAPGSAQPPRARITRGASQRRGRDGGCIFGGLLSPSWRIRLVVRGTGDGYRVSGRRPAANINLMWNPRRAARFPRPTIKLYCAAPSDVEAYRVAIRDVFAGAAPWRRAPSKALIVRLYSGRFKREDAPPCASIGFRWLHCL